MNDLIPDKNSRPPLRFVRIILVALTALALNACDTTPVDDTKTGGPSDDAGYVGAAACAGCHAAQAELWRNSHHDLAMQAASPATALGDFNDGRFEHNGVSSRFFSEGSDLFVETDGSDGELAVFPVRYAFGVYPLQQYLLELPNGKIQALSIAWDTRPAEEGGQRWFHTYGDEQIDHTDVLHWTRMSQNWETMCADCHSTNLVSDYDIEQDRFDTTWAELNVACEACHGPGKTHVAWAEDPDLQKDNGLSPNFDESDGVNWILNPDTGNSARSITRASNKELNACAGCHSRRARIAEGNHPATAFLDNYSPALIERGLYHRDGQILDEVYVYGSFLQSKMHAEGVSCSDCHDPHSLELRAPGPQVCLQCHASETFATVEHQMHENGITNCIDCHMPATTYMQIDARNDHSFRVPRPQLTVAYGVPNACNGCHEDRDAAWAVAALTDSGRLPDTEAHWTQAFVASAGGDQAAMQARIALATDPEVPNIIRASVISRIGLADVPTSQQLLLGLANSPDALLRWGTARSLDNSQPQLAASQGVALIKDPTLAVRLAATSTLARMDPVMLPGGSYTDLQKGYEEYKTAQLVNAERPESHINIANLERNQGRWDSAEESYRTAISLNPQFIPAYVNLADLYREWNRETDADAVLREGLDALPNQPGLHHALGLSLIRQNRADEAINELRIAAESPDATPRFALVYAIALNSTGKTDESIRVLSDALERFGEDPQLRNAFAEFSAQLQ